MTTYKPRGRYDFCLDIKATIFGTADESIVLFPDFECQVDIDCELSGGELSTTCTDVLIDGVSLAHGDDLAKRIRTFVMAQADEQLENGGGLFEDVRDAEGLSLSGHPGDPDAHWQQAW